MAFQVKTSRILIPAGTFTAQQATLLQKDPAATALRLYLNLTAVSGTGGIYPVIRGYDKISNNPVELSTGGDVVNQIGTYAYEMGVAPDPAFAALREAVSRSVPFVWDVQIKVLDATSYTYSLSAEIMMV